MLDYIFCWKNINDIRWLIYLLSNNDRLKNDYSINLILREFTISLAEDINKMSGKETLFYNDLKKTISEHIVTGLNNSIIAQKRSNYFSLIANEPINVRNMYEFNLYFSVLDGDIMRAALNSYVNAINFIENFSDGNKGIVNDFKLKLTEDFKNQVECKIFVDDKYMLAPYKILNMYKNNIFPEYSYDLVYIDNTAANCENKSDFFEIWNNENDIRWLLYYLLNDKKTDENKIRQFTLDTLLLVINKCNAENYLRHFSDDINLIQDSIYGIIRKEVVAASSKKDNVFGHNMFSRMWNMIRCAVNSLKFEDVTLAVITAFYFILVGIKSCSKIDKGFYERVIKEIIIDLREQFENPFANFDFININYKSIECLKQFDYIPKRVESKWLFNPDNLKII